MGTLVVSVTCEETVFLTEAIEMAARHKLRVAGHRQMKTRLETRAFRVSGQGGASL